MVGLVVVNYGSNYTSGVADIHDIFRVLDSVNGTTVTDDVAVVTACVAVVTDDNIFLGLMFLYGLMLFELEHWRFIGFIGRLDLKDPP